jgi:hypothetical protein
MFFINFLFWVELLTLLLDKAYQVAWLGQSLWLSVVQTSWLDVQVQFFLWGGGGITESHSWPDSGGSKMHRMPVICVNRTF